MIKMSKGDMHCNGTPDKKRKQANHITLEACLEPCQTPKKSKIANGL